MCTLSKDKQFPFVCLCDDLDLCINILSKFILKDDISIREL